MRTARYDGFDVAFHRYRSGYRGHVERLAPIGFGNLQRKRSVQSAADSDCDMKSFLKLSRLTRQRPENNVLSDTSNRGGVAIP